MCEVILCEDTPIFWTVVCDTIKKMLWKKCLIGILDIWVISSSLQISHYNAKF